MKTRNILPLAAHQCGLITKSDAERLISYLGMCSLQKEANENVDELLLDDPRLIDAEEVLYVVHECFGRGKGALYPDLYETSSSKCIRCKECSK